MEARVGLKQVPVSRVERGEQLVSAELVRLWAHTLGASDEATERVLALVHAAHGETRPWAELGAGKGGLQAVAGDREDDARRVRDCCLTWIPGLCQTGEYARLLMRQVDPDESIDHAAAVAARIERQQILYREGREFEFLVGEEALRWSPGPGVMAGQRDKLATIATLSGVRVRVLASARIGEPAWHNFVLYDPADGTDTYVTTELLHGGQESHDAKAVARYEALWSRLWAAAAHGDDALALIRKTQT
jgi:Domain of unknown function (DUF5753)